MAEAFLRNAWYVGAWPEEIGQTPFRRVLLERPVVFWRRQDGGVAALHDVCPHRFVPLSMGKVAGDEIECCYHGLRFNGSGACTLNPHGDGVIPRAARVDAYPVVERHGLVWIWMGDPAAADPQRIPEAFAPVGDTARWTTVGGMLHVAANYQLITDNLLDLSHVQFLHPGLLVAGAARIRHEMRQEGERVISYFWRDGGLPNGLSRLLGWPADKPGDTRAHMHWHPPSLMWLDVGMTELGGTVEQGILQPSVHLLTPETRSSTHYFFAVLRQIRRDDADLSRQMKALVQQAFVGEDKPVIEAQQREINAGEIMTLNPALLQPDAAAIRARRVLDALVAAEQK